LRVVRYYSNNDLRVEEMPKPDIGESEMLVRVEASGICGSDVMEWYRIDRVPLVLGHEIAGTVVETGKRVRSYKPGDRVVVAHHVPCGECRYCRDGHDTVCDTLRKTNFYPGGFSEFIRVPKINVEKGVFLIPRSVSFEEATFVEPLACVVRGQRMAGFKKGKTVLVAGSGISGILHTKLAKASGAKRIFATDISDYRLESARKAGADHVFKAGEYTPSVLREHNDGYLADLVVICASPKSAFEHGLRSVERGGTVLIFSASGKDETFTVPINEIFWRNEVTLVSSYGAGPGDHIDAMERIRSRKINVYDMITHRLPLAETGAGFMLVAGAGNSMKVIIEPQK
jgi:L-iditol 2-dehydrogenase